MSKTFKIIAAILSVAIVGIAGYFGYTKWKSLNDKIKAQDKEIAQLKNVEVEEDLTIEERPEEKPEEKPQQKQPEKVVSTEKTGKIKFNAGFPSSFNPAFRICFSNYNDISLQYCYWVKNSNDKKEYSADLVWTSSGYEVTLPVGKYIVDFTLYTFESLDSQSSPQNVEAVYALKECVYYADGESQTDTLQYCGSVEKELKKHTGISGPYDSILLNNSKHGGKMMTFDVKDGGVTTIKKFSLSPYLDLNR